VSSWVRSGSPGSFGFDRGSHAGGDLIVARFSPLGSSVADDKIRFIRGSSSRRGESLVRDSFAYGVIFMLPNRSCRVLPALSAGFCGIIALIAPCGAVAAEAPPRSKAELVIGFPPIPEIEAARLAFDRFKKLEVGEMFIAIIEHGSDMGPGTGWFHPTLSRYDWNWLAKRCGVDPSAAIPRDKFPGSDKAFDRLDRDHDGLIKADDFDWSESSPYLERFYMENMRFRMIDSNSNGQVSSIEWARFFQRAAKGKSFLTPDDLREAFTPRPAPAADPKQPAASEGPSRAVLLKGLAAGEVGSWFEGPKLNDKAPDFTLTTHDGKEQITMSQFRRDKPIVLVFGSFT
jgi:hypothetical protein